MDIPNIYSQYSLPSLEGTSTHTFLTELITKDEEQNRDAGQYTTKEEEKWEVTALPLDWVPDTRPSKIIKRYLTRKENQHKKTMELMKENMARKNDETEEQIRLQAEFLKKTIKHIQQEIETYVYGTRFDTTKSLNIDVKEFLVVAENMHLLHRRRRTKICLYHQCLKHLEKKRIETFKLILKKTYQKLINDCYKLPYDIENYFQSEISKINGITLSNLRSYEELYLHLISVVENQMRLSLQDLQLNKEKWIKHNNVLAVLKLNAEALEKPDYSMFHKKAQRVYSRFLEFDEELSVKFSTLNPVYMKPGEYQMFFDQVEESVNALNVCSKKLIELYRLAMAGVFTGYFDSWKILTNQMLDTGEVTKTEIIKLQSEYVIPVLDETCIKYDYTLHEMQEHWKSVQVEFSSKLQRAFEYLKFTSLVWENYYKNRQKAKDIVRQDAVLTIVNNDKTGRGYDSKLNMIGDVLRQQPTIDKLDDSLDILFEYLDQFKKTYYLNYEKEVKPLEKYVVLMEIVISILLAQLMELTFYYPKDKSLAPSVMKPRASQCSIHTETEDDIYLLLPQQVKICEFQIDALDHWWFGFCEAIEKYLSTCRAEIIAESIEWIKELTEKIESRFNIKMALHQARYKKEKDNIYELRKAELKLHAERMEQHKAGVIDEIEKMKETHENLQNECKKIVDILKEEADGITIQYKKAKKSSSVKKLFLTFQRIVKLYDGKMLNLIDGIKENCKRKFYCILESGIQYRKNLKLFAEGGCFHPEEVKAYLGELNKLDKMTMKKYTTFIKDFNLNFNHYYSQFCGLHLNVTNSLQTLYEEFNLNEKTVEMIKKLQFVIRHEVYQMKYDYKKLLACYKEFHQKAGLVLGNVEYIKEIKKAVEEIVAKSESYFTYLLVPKDLFEESYKFIKERLIPSGEPVLKFYGEEPFQDESFWCKIANGLHKSFADISMMAQKFYESKTVFISENKVQPTFEAFIKEVLEKYVYYHLQCEPVWLERTKEFLSLVYDFEMFMLDYNETFKKSYTRIERCKIKKYNSTIRNEIKTLKRNSFASFKSLHNQLKPLHGHPNNKHLLADLETQMSELIECQKDNIIHMLVPHKETYSERKEHFLIILNSIKTEFDDILCKVESKPKYDLLSILHENKINTFVTLLQEEAVKEEESKSNSNISVIVDNFKKMLNIPSYIVSTPELSESSQFSFFKEENLFPLSNSKFFDDLMDQDLCTYVSQKYDKKYNAFMEELSEIEANSSTDSDKWKLIWEADLKRIFKLYTVKYNLKND